MATLNPPIQTTGHLPRLGHSLQVYEPYFAITFACIVGVHLAIFVASATWTRGTGTTGADEMELGLLPR